MLRDLVLPHDALLLVLDRQKAEILRNHGNCTQLVLETEVSIHAPRPADGHHIDGRDFAAEVSSALRRLTSRHPVPGIVMLVDRRDMSLAKAVRDGVFGRPSAWRERPTIEGGGFDGEGRRPQPIPGTSTFLIVLTRRDRASLRNVRTHKDGGAIDA